MTKITGLATDRTDRPLDTQPTMSVDPTGLYAGASASARDANGVTKAPTYTFLSHQLNVAIDSSTPLPTIPIGAKYAQIQAAVQNARYRYDGATTPPTASSGMRLLANSELACDVADLSTMRFISETPGALLNIAYFS